MAKSIMVAETDRAKEPEDETEVKAAVEILRVSFRALTTGSAREPLGILTAEDRDALAVELRAGRRGDAALAHTLAWLLVPSEDGPKSDALRCLGLVSVPPAAVEVLGRVVQMAALTGHACDYVRRKFGDAPAELAAVELTEWDWDGALNRIQALSPTVLQAKQELDSEQMIQAYSSVRDILIDLFVTVNSSSPVSAALESSLSALRLQSLVSRVLGAFNLLDSKRQNPRQEHVLSWFARTATGSVLRAAVRRLAAEAAEDLGAQRGRGTTT